MLADYEFTHYTKDRREEMAVCSHNWILLVALAVLYTVPQIGAPRPASLPVESTVAASVLPASTAGTASESTYIKPAGTTPSFESTLPRHPEPWTGRRLTTQADSLFTTQPYASSSYLPASERERDRERQAWLTIIEWYQQKFTANSHLESSHSTSPPEVVHPSPASTAFDKFHILVSKLIHSYALLDSANGSFVNLGPNWPLGKGNATTEQMDHLSSQNNTRLLIFTLAFIFLILATLAGLSIHITFKIDAFKKMWVFQHTMTHTEPSPALPSLPAPDSPIPQTDPSRMLTRAVYTASPKTGGGYVQLGFTEKRKQIDF
jgi:hypothetical protein